MTLGLVYPIGISIAVIIALLWSFVFDQQKPPTTKEFAAKLVARALFLIALFAIFMGFLDLAFGLFR
ncbi:MAG: hypothetical protein QM483_06490 [Desulfuromusa sp.]